MVKRGVLVCVMVMLFLMVGCSHNATRNISTAGTVSSLATPGPGGAIIGALTLPFTVAHTLHDVSDGQNNRSIIPEDLEDDVDALKERCLELFHGNSFKDDEEPSAEYSYTSVENNVYGIRCELSKKMEDNSRILNFYVYRDERFLTRFPYGKVNVDTPADNK